MPRMWTRSIARQCPVALDMAAYLDGREGSRLRRQLEDHFASCPACRRALIDLRAILATPEMSAPSADHGPLALELAARLRALGQAETASGAQTWARRVS